MGGFRPSIRQRRQRMLFRNKTAKKITFSIECLQVRGGGGGKSTKVVFAPSRRNYFGEINLRSLHNYKVTVRHIRISF